MVKRMIAPDQAAEPAQVGQGGEPSSMEALAQTFEAEDAAAGAADIGTAGDAVQEPPKATNAQILTSCFVAIRETVCMLAGLESPKRTFTDDKAEKLGALWGDVCTHYGLDLADSLGEHAVLFAAAVGTFQLLGETVVQARAEITTKDKARPTGEVAAASPAPLVTDRAASNARDFVPGVVKPSFDAR